MSELEIALSKILKGRDERAALQKILLSIDGIDTVVQISLNIPGYPKRLENDIEALAEAEAVYAQKCGAPCAVRVSATNGVGAALLMGYSGLAAADAKKKAIEVENWFEWGRVLDIDILSHSGQLSRDNLGHPTRKCVVCEKDAKVCSREGNHSIEEVREKSRILLSALAGQRSSS